MKNDCDVLYCIGIGGKGVASVASLFLQMGKKVVGSDLVETRSTKQLAKEGATISIGKQKKENIPNNVDIAVYSKSITDDNSELIELKNRNISCYTYPSFVALLTKNKKVIGISGTHGKSTTTALTGIMLEHAKLDPTVVVGSYVPFFKSTARYGLSDYFVLEADEYRLAFHEYSAQIAVVTSIDFDHPDCFPDINAVKNAFKGFIDKMPQDGVIVANADDVLIKEVVSSSNRETIWYGIESDDAQIRAKNIHFSDKTTFDCYLSEGEIKDITLHIPGTHNISNALAAIGVGKVLNVPEALIKEGLYLYKGAFRRFEVRGEVGGITIIDDYAHHPLEVQKTIEAARLRFPGRRVVAVFQPHHQERTRALFSEFSEALSVADFAVITDVYRVPGRTSEEEIPMKKMAFSVREKGVDSLYVANYNELPALLPSKLSEGDVVLIMGAGNINTIIPALVKKIS